MLSKNHVDALRKIVSAAEMDTSIVWALTGSTSFVLQGMALTVHDIDIQTDEDSAYKFETQLQKYIVEPVHFCETEAIRSHFGKLKICNVDVEIMGDIQKRISDGSWEKKFSILPIIQYINFEKMKIPVLSLAYEAEAYRNMGRIDRANDIQQFISSRGECNE